MNFSELIKKIEDLNIKNENEIDRKIVNFADFLFDMLANDVCQSDVQQALAVVRGITGLTTRLEPDSIMMNVLLFIRSELFDAEVLPPGEQEECIKRVLKLMEYAFHPLS